MMKNKSINPDWVHFIFADSAQENFEHIASSS